VRWCCDHADDGANKISHEAKGLGDKRVLSGKSGGCQSQPGSMSGVPARKGRQNILWRTGDKTVSDGNEVTGPPCREGSFGPIRFLGSDKGGETETFQ